MTQQALAVVLVAMLAVASVASVSAMTPQTQTVEQSDINSNLMAADFENASEFTHQSNVTGFEANDSIKKFVEQNTSSTNPEVRLRDNETGEVLATWASDDLTQTYSDSVNDDYAYRLNVTHGDLSDVDIRAGETKNVTFRYVDNASKSAENETYTNVSVELTAADHYNNFRVDGSLISSTDLIAFETDGFTLMGQSFFADEKTHFTAENVAINGSDSEVNIDLANQTAQDRLSTSLEDVSESNWDKSTVITLTTGDDEEVLVKGYTELPDDVNESADTYALIDESSNTLDIHLGDEFEGESSVEEVSVKTNVGDYPAFARQVEFMMQGFEVSNLNPLTVLPDVDGQFDLGGATMPSLGTIVPMAVGRRKLV